MLSQYITDKAQLETILSEATKDIKVNKLAFNQFTKLSDIIPVIQQLESIITRRPA